MLPASSRPSSRALDRLKKSIEIERLQKPEKSLIELEKAMDANRMVAQAEAAECQSRAPEE